MSNSPNALAVAYSFCSGLSAFMNTSLAPARGVIWSFSTTSPRTVTTLLRLTVFSGRIRAVPGRGYDALPGPAGNSCGLIIVSEPPGITPGGFSRSSLTDGPPDAPGTPAGAGGKKLAAAGGHGAGGG